MKKRISILFMLLFLLIFTGGRGNPSKEIKTSSGVEMVLIPGGWFIMGDKEGEVDEKPPHKVYISSFYMDKYPVTQEEYEKVMGENPSKWIGKRKPVEQVTWFDAVRYCNARSKLEGLQPCYDTKTWKCNFEANGYRLPTEAEWEYACRAGSTTKYFFGNDPNKLKYFAWYKENSNGKTHPVGQKLPNRWGLYDMYGNVFEWCNDFYKRDYYKESPEKNPEGPETGKEKVVRGGSWNSTSEECRSSYRYKEDPGYGDICIGAYNIYGFRCVRKAE